MRITSLALILLLAGCSSPPPPVTGTRRGPWENEAAWRAGHERRRAAREAELEAARRAQAERAAARRVYVAEHRGKRPDEVLDALAAESIALGMSHAEVQLLVDGAAVRRTVTGEGVGEAWTVGDLTFTLRNGQVTSWSAPGSDPTQTKTVKVPQPAIPENTAY